MMTLLGKAFSALFGKYLGTLTTPAMALGLVVLLHQFWLARDARLKAEASNICTAHWETEIRKQERDTAAQAASAAHKILEGERAINEGLRHALDTLKSQHQTLSDASAGSDARCLSDGVLRALGNGDASGSRPKRPAKAQRD
jgi:hypothetical protein